jgi:hypothetical protein
VRAAQVRLRFVVVFAAAFFVVGRWDALVNGWDRLTRSAFGGGSGEQSAVSNDTEYFCPMDPGVASDWPGKCGVCNMALVRRKRGEAAALPNGVVARMQISPYRMQLAGVNTSPIGYRPLGVESRLVGVVAHELKGTQSKKRVDAVAYERDLPALSRGGAAEVSCRALPGLGPFGATIVSIGPADAVLGVKVALDVDDPSDALVLGLNVAARVSRPVSELEPFRSLPADPPVLRPTDPRAIYICPDHDEAIRIEAGRCPIDGKAALEHRPLLANQRVGWWCPMHPSVTADARGAKCAQCGGMTLVPRVSTFRPRGEVLAVPESAVVDSGARAVVYVERSPGMFDGVEVVLGPRCGAFYPVARGLEPGQRVATAGAFLIDAETRLNPALASAYFGASLGGRSEAPAAPTVQIPTAPSARPSDVCPVTGKRLGSMGPPVEATVEGRVVRLCCDACLEPLRANPSKYLSRPNPKPKAGP